MGVGRSVRLGGIAAIVTVWLSACGALAGLGEPAADANRGMPEPIGPVVEIGSGVGEGFAWRYSVYESADGPCMQLEIRGPGGGGGLTCGGVIGRGVGESAIGLSGVGSGTGMPTQIEGFATERVAEVWIETDDGRMPAALMALGLFDIEGQAFVAFVPADVAVDGAVALDGRGEEIGRVEIDVPRP